MRILCGTVWPAIMAAGLVTLAGCAPAPDERLTNQGVGTLTSVAAKLGGSPDDPPIGTLNPDEWQVLFDTAFLYGPQFGLTLPEGVQSFILSDEQAQALVNFLQVNNIQTQSQLKSAIDGGSLAIPDELAALFG